MTDLVDWYNAAEQEGKLSPVELAVLFHYRYIRIHPFEDGNGRIARLMVNYKLTRHRWPMIVIRNRKKAEYIEALHRSDQKVGNITSDGANAPIGKITSFLAFFRNTVCEELLCNIGIVKNSAVDTWWYDGQRIVFRSENGSRLLNLMKNKPYITYSELSESLSINRSAVQKQIDSFRKKGYLERRENGQWHILAINSKIRYRPQAIYLLTLLTADGKKHTVRLIKQ